MSGAPSSLPFAEQAWLGQSQWWRAVLALVLVLASWIALTVVALVFVHLFGLSGSDLARAGAGAAPDDERLIYFVVVLLSVAILVVPERIILPLLHRRPWRSFLTARPRFSFARAGASFAILFALLLCSLGLQLVFFPGALAMNPAPARILPFAAAAILILPFQVLAEEIFFRGYIFQLVGRLTQRTLIRIGFPALLFAAAHASNPETAYGFSWAIASYALAGVYFALLTLRDDGIEAAAGAHFANNLCALTLAGTDISAAPSPTLYVDHAPDLTCSFVAGAVVFALHFVLYLRLFAVKSSRP